jgi:hypothetical protein
MGNENKIVGVSLQRARVGRKRVKSDPKRTRAVATYGKHEKVIVFIKMPLISDM